MEEAHSVDLRGFLKMMEEKGEVVRVKREVSPLYEAAAVMKKLDKGPIAFFEGIKGSGLPLVSGVSGKRERICMAINSPVDELHDRLSSAIADLKEVPVVQDGPVKERSEKPRLSMLPIVKHYEGDAGPYITSGVVFARDPETGAQNASIHRLLLLDDGHFAIRVVEGRHLHRIVQLHRQMKRNVEVAIAIGLHPAVTLAAACQPPYGVDEMGIANTLLDGALTMTKCETVDLMVPSTSEMVLEGELLTDKDEEEFMMDVLGIYDHPRRQPVIEVKNFLHREKPIYQDILPAGSEHRLLMSLPVEVRMLNGVRDAVPSTKAVRLTDGGCNWLHAVIQIKKTHEGEAKNAILSAFAHHPSLKLAIVVDEDIDPNDAEGVEFAMATRFQGDKGLMVLPNVKGSSLDPSSDQANLLTTKVGIDATISLFKEREKFVRAKVPGEDSIDLEKYIEG